LSADWFSWVGSTNLLCVKSFNSLILGTPMVLRRSSGLCRILGGGQDAALANSVRADPLAGAEPFKLEQRSEVPTLDGGSHGPQILTPWRLHQHSFLHEKWFLQFSFSSLTHLPHPLFFLRSTIFNATETNWDDQLELH
jgi:hypothetical protein